MTIMELKSAVRTALERNKLLRGTEVEALTNFGKTKRGELIRAGLFPQPVRVLNEHQLPGRTKYWTQGEILDYLQAQVDARNKRIAEIAKDGLNQWLTSASAPRKSVGGEHHA